jgi:hypothetical protein
VEEEEPIEEASGKDHEIQDPALEDGSWQAEDMCADSAQEEPEGQADPTELAPECEEMVVTSSYQEELTTVMEMPDKLVEEQVTMYSAPCEVAPQPPLSEKLPSKNN